MMKLILAIGISLIVGFAAASWMETSLVSSGSQQIEAPAISSFDEAAPVEERIRALELAVIQEQQARQVLEEELYFLREELDQRDAETAVLEEQAQVARSERRQAIMSRRSGGSTQARLDRLVEAGFPPDQAQWIVDREAELQMERLQARYEAMRGNEGQAVFGGRFAQDGELREELGDADYERYLAANGRPTSVGIGNVLPNSPAQSGGLRPGDEIVRYDGERVFSMMDVAGQIMRGEPEGNVVVDIVRDGAPLQLVLPRGPLGVMGN